MQTHVASEGEDSAPRGRRIVLTLVIATLCVIPYRAILTHPCLFSDDVTRIADLQVMPLATMLVRPFNEHLAPLFELVSYAAWRSCGRSLERSPGAFTLASFVPLLLVAWMLWTLARRELESTTAALASLAIFLVTPVYFEVLAWYSASSFTWSLLGTLGAWYGGVRARDPARPSTRAAWYGVAALSSLMAPAFSAIGLLAGLVGAVAAASTPEQNRGGGRWARFGAFAPLAGTLIYLVLATAFRYHDLLADSLQRNGDVPTGVLSIARAPLEILLPSLVGIPPSNHLRFPLVVSLTVSALGLAGILFGSWFSVRRPLLLGGLVLIVGGYGLTYTVRTSHGPYWILRVDRYHLLPQAGFSLIVAAALRPWLSRFDRRPIRGLVVAVAMATLLFAAHRDQFALRSRAYYFPDQHRTLAALDDLGRFCTSEGITRGQALAALDPIRTRWFSRNENALIMLADTVAVPRMADERVRPALLSALTPARREALCGGMDASPYLQPAGDVDERSLAVGRLVGTLRVRRSGAVGHYDVSGSPSFLEYDLPAPACPGETDPGARFLYVPIDADGKTMEIWWSDRDDRWSETRSIRWRPDPARPAGYQSVPLDKLPHWSPEGARHIRLMFRAKGAVAIEAPPRLLR
jgi:hypothetical protein